MTASTHRNCRALVAAARAALRFLEEGSLNGKPDRQERRIIADLTKALKACDKTA